MRASSFTNVLHAKPSCAQSPATAASFALTAQTPVRPDPSTHIAASLLIPLTSRPFPATLFSGSQTSLSAATAAGKWSRPTQPRSRRNRAPTPCLRYKVSQAMRVTQTDCLSMMCTLTWMLARRAISWKALCVLPPFGLGNSTDLPIFSFLSSGYLTCQVEGSRFSIPCRSISLLTIALVKLSSAAISPIVSFCFT